MAKAKTPSFVLELELFLTPHERKQLKKKLNIGRQIYNACLGEVLKRLHKIQNDKAYGMLVKALKALIKRIAALEKQPASKEQKEALKQLKQQKTRLMAECKSIELAFGYSEYQLHAWSAECGHHFEGQLGINEIQKLATRAFQAVEKVHYQKAEQVHFKKTGELISVENKSNKTGLRWKNGRFFGANWPWRFASRKKMPMPRKHWSPEPNISASYQKSFVEKNVSMSS